MRPSKGRRFGADPGRALGDHPAKGGPITAKKGRYGPYVSHNGVNATLPADKTPETVTLDEAVALIDARAERTGGPRRTRARARPSGRRRERRASSKRRRKSPAPANGRAHASRPRKRPNNFACCQNGPPDLDQ